MAIVGEKGKYSLRVMNRKQMIYGLFFYNKL